MGVRHLVTIDKSGRLVVPKALRDELAVGPGQQLEAQVRDGRLEIEPRPFQAELVESDGLLLIVPREPTPVLTADDVRAVLESVRR